MNNLFDPDENHCILKTFADAAGPTPPAKPQRNKPVSVRFTPEERTLLEQRAGKRSLSSFLRECALGDDVSVRKSRGTNPVKDHVALARVLSALGRSNLARDLDTLSWSIEEGMLHLSEPDQRVFRDACVSVVMIRRDLMKALGLKQPTSGKPMAD